MITTAVSATVEAPIDEVWNFMVDLPKMILDPSVVDVAWQPPLKVGSVATVTFRQMGTRTARLEVTDMEPRRRLRIVMTAMGSTLDGTYVMEPLDDGKTKLSAVAEIEVHGPLKLIAPYLSYSAKRDQSKEMARLKKAIEAQVDKPWKSPSPPV